MYETQKYYLAMLCKFVSIIFYEKCVLMDRFWVPDHHGSLLHVVEEQPEDPVQLNA
jgi:hypothetical protein